MIALATFSYASMYNSSCKEQLKLFASNIQRIITSFSTV